MKVPKPKVVRDPAYLKAVRQMPCMLWNVPGHICGETMGRGPSEASHLDTKSRDDRTLPMCGVAHRTGRWSWHAGQKSFCTHYGLTKTQLIREAEALYREWKDGIA